MCDIEKIKKEKDELLEKVDKTVEKSNANIIMIKENIKNLDKIIDRNLHELSLLL